MSLELIATIGAADANSLVTEDEANDIMLQIPGGRAWQEVDFIDGASSLIAAMDYINSLRWRGCRVDAVQALELPRANLSKRGSLEYFASDEIPAAAKKAQCIWALRVELPKRKAGYVPGRRVASQSADGWSKSYDYSKEQTAEQQAEAEIAVLLNGLVWFGTELVRG